jgi:hypothetical protein
MDPILDATAAINVREPGDHLLYCAAATTFDVNRDTLRSRHKGLTRSNAGEAQRRMLLSPQQEIHLVRYIERLTEQSIPPTRKMIRNFASKVANWEVQILGLRVFC